MISPWLLPTPPPHQTIVLRHSSGPDLPSPAPLAGAPLPTEYSRNTVPPEPSARCPASHSVLAHGFPWVPDAPQQDTPFPGMLSLSPPPHPGPGYFTVQGMMSILSRSPHLPMVVSAAPWWREPGGGLATLPLVSANDSAQAALLGWFLAHLLA